MTRNDRPGNQGRLPSDYRQSHLASGKGASYDTTFSENPYRHLIWEMEKRALDRVVREDFAGREIRHLDFACGTGGSLRHIAPKACLSVGVDVSPSMMAVAREDPGRAEILETDLTAVDILGDREFDLITAFRFFPNAEVRLREEAMRVLRRHLAPGGRLVFNNHKNLGSLKYRLARLRRRGGREGMSRREARDLVARNGLVIERAYALGFTPAGDERLFLPLTVVRRVEGALARCPALRSLGESVIFICRPAEGR